MMAERCERRSSGLGTMTTGPTSPEGMARSSRNSYKGGQRPIIRAFARALKDQKNVFRRTLVP